jgi:hypothetical protein
MGKSKTAARAARAAGKQVAQGPPKPKRHAWFRNPAFHQFEGITSCNFCNQQKELHVLDGEGQEGRRIRLSMT